MDKQVSPKDEIAIFLDGAYIENLCFDLHINFDFKKLLQEMSFGFKLYSATYYDCVIFDDPVRMEKRYKYLDAIQYRAPGLRVKTGKVQRKSNGTNGYAVYVQKGVDTAIAVDMGILAGKKAVEKMALFSGDGDMLPIIQAVEQEGIEVELWYGNTENASPSRDLLRSCQNTSEVTPKFAYQRLAYRNGSLDSRLK